MNHHSDVRDSTGALATKDFSMLTDFSADQFI
jgi:hypothetical protein